VVGLAGVLRTRDTVEIEPLVVARRHRRRGVATRLVNGIIERAKLGRVERVVVRPVSRNTAAFRAFHSLGFARVGHIELDVDLRRRAVARTVGKIRIGGRQFRT
jgi:GNAT superfamily N-acetyltransferase